MAKKKGKKNRKAQKKKTTKQTIDLTLRLNVELQQQKKKRTQPRQRVKRITSRNRMNLREMRQSMPGAGGPNAFANPAFYGNIKQLNNSALNQFQNQRYSLENQVRESAAEQKALLAAGKVQAAQQLADALTEQAKQLTDLQHKFGFQSQQQIAQISAAAGAEHQKAQAAEQQLEQTAIDEGDRQARMAQVQLLTDQELKQQVSALPAFARQDFSPEAIKPAKFKETKGLMRKVLAFGEPADEAELVRAFSATDRARGKSKSRAARLAQMAEQGTPRKAVRGFGDDSSEEEVEFFSEEEGTP